MDELRKEKECLHADDEVEYFGEGKYNRARKIVWDLLEKPQTSKTANVSQDPMQLMPNMVRASQLLQ